MKKKVALESKSSKAGTGFLQLMESESQKTPAAIPNLQAREERLLTFMGIGRDTDDSAVNIGTLPSDSPPIPVDNNMAIENDIGPFHLATSQMVQAFDPVLVIVPHSASIDFVIVGLTPLDVYYSFGA